MKSLILTTIIAVFLLLFPIGIQAQSPQTPLNKACLDNTEQFSIISEYVKGEKYRIQVGLPINYSESQKVYPVLFVLDGDKIFGMTKEIAECMEMGQDINDIIIIGISYGQGTNVWGDKRLRDFTDCADTGYFRINQNSGGADNFLKFIQYELFPVVNKSYKINPDSVSIAGWSLGGYFCSYVLFKQPELFKNYLIFSPVIIWNNKNIIKMENEYFRTHKELKNNVFMAYASLDIKDWVIDPTDELIGIIQKRKYQSFNFITQIFDGETHNSVPSAAIKNGLKLFYHRH